MTTSVGRQSEVLKRIKPHFLALDAARDKKFDMSIDFESSERDLGAIASL